MLHELRFALRMLLKSPGFTAIAVTVLAFAIGGTTAMFTLVDALMLRPIVAKDPQNLVRVYSHENKPQGGYRAMSYPEFVDMQERNGVFSEVTTFAIAPVGVSEGEMTQRTLAAIVPANYFDTFGVRLASGRTFSEEEERPASAVPVVIVSHGFWESRGADPAFVGQTVRINSRECTVVGIAPEFFTGPNSIVSPDFWLPLGMYELAPMEFLENGNRPLNDRANHCLFTFGRLKPGLTMASAQEQLAPLAAQLAEDYPAENRDWGFELGPLTRVSLGTRPSNESTFGVLSILLMAMSGAVLLIACLNLTNMQLARGSSRRREIAVRLALGGSRWRIVRQLLAEGAVLAAAGGVAGLVLSSWITELLTHSLASRVQFFRVVFDPQPNLAVLGATIAFCALSVVLFALGPAWRLSRSDVVSNLKAQPEEQLGGASGASIFAPRNLLVVGQIMLSLALIAGAGMFTRGAINAARATPGFSLERSILAEVDAGFVGYDEAKRLRLFPEIADHLRTLPGVEAASFANIVPFGLVQDGQRVAKAGSGTQDATTAGAELNPEAVDAGFNIVSDDYFRTLGLTLLRGREFEPIEVESTTAPRVAIIDTVLAEKLFPGEDPLGRQIVFTGVDGFAASVKDAMEIVGVVPSIRDSLQERGPGPHVYVPFGHKPRATATFHLKVRLESGQGESAMLKTVRETILAIDADLPLLTLQSFQQFHAEGLSVWMANTGARLFAGFGSLALFLAVVGLYGVTAYLVARRTREIGIRMALGASTRDVLRMFLRDGTRTVVVGTALGLGLAAAVGVVLQNMLFEVSALDPVVLASASLLLASTTLAACLIPARAASRIQPLTALRAE